MFEERRRYVTGHNAQGRSIVAIEGAPGNTLDAGLGGLGEIWSAGPGPVDSRSKEDPSTGQVLLNPPVGGHKFRYFQIAPEDLNLPEEELRKHTAAVFEAIGAAHDQVDTARHAGMHKTKTIDYIILLSGEATLLLDEEERHLKPFDVVVQRGTNHAWVNKGTEPELFIAVLIDAEILE
jgi:hypothetical protein